MKYNNLAVGDIILVPFPFTDLSSQKLRPVVILSIENSFLNDFIVGAISSQKSQNNTDLTITNNCLIKGNLPLTSFFKTGKLATLNSSIIQRKIGELNQETKEEILTKTKNLFNFSVR